MAHQSFCLSPVSSPAQSPQHNQHILSLLNVAQHHLQLQQHSEAKEALQGFLQHQLEAGHHVAGPASTAWALDMLGDALLHLGHAADAVLELYTAALDLLLLADEPSSNNGHVAMLRAKIADVEAAAQQQGEPGAVRQLPQALEQEQVPHATSSAAEAHAATPQAGPHPKRSSFRTRSSSAAAQESPAAAPPSTGASTRLSWLPSHLLPWRNTSPIQLVSCQAGSAAAPGQTQQGHAGLSSALWSIGGLLLRRPSPGQGQAAAAGKYKVPAPVGHGASATQRLSQRTLEVSADSFGTAVSSNSMLRCLAESAGGSRLSWPESDVFQTNPADLQQPWHDADPDPPAHSHLLPSTSILPPAAPAAMAPAAPSGPFMRHRAAERGTEPPPEQAQAQARGLPLAAALGPLLIPKKLPARWWSTSSDIPASPSIAAAKAIAAQAAHTARTAGQPEQLPAWQLELQLARDEPGGRTDNVQQWLSGCDDRVAWQQHLAHVERQVVGQATPGWCSASGASPAMSPMPSDASAAADALMWQ